MRYSDTKDGRQGGILAIVTECREKKLIQPTVTDSYNNTATHRQLAR
jgi:hypothetical protein